MSPDTLQWLGCISGVVGSLLLALHNRHSGWGFVFFLISNVFWISYGFAIGAMGLISMQCIFFVTSVLGVYKWFGLTSHSTTSHN
jgi:nicotinamide riboside transporter PnuC